MLRRAMRMPMTERSTILTLAAQCHGRGPCDFRLPEPHLPARVLLDSAEPDADERDVTRHDDPVAAHSAVLLLRRASA